MIANLMQYGMNRELAERADFGWDPRCSYSTELFQSSRARMQIDFEDEQRRGQQAVALVNKKSVYRERDENGNYIEHLARPGLPSSQLDHKKRDEERKRISKLLLQPV